ncbi:MAG: FAD binding domain-containing protein [Lutibacter sp.]|uniref:FAD binding domain-containing protein n=1 Tax=Lutibacter sp. TaxID=1925666 RepID=UPI00385960BB
MIQFILNNQVIKTTAKAGMTLLDFIRENKQLKGTKIGCREGDCGACTVLVGTLNNNNISYQSITSCISPLGNANGKHIVTVEGINLPESLNFVQQKMVDNYATQCGYCTPGFVVSLAGYAIEKSSESTATSNDAMSGNICRCTGYKSIEKAAVLVDEKLEEKDKNNQIAWLIKEGFIPDYFRNIPQKLQQLKPVGLEKKGTIVANGTDLYVHNADKFSEEAIYLISNENSLKGISFTKNICTLGANTTVTQILENKRLKSIFPKLKQFLKLVSSEQIRNMGTLGGNFVNASPIGDMSIFFLALNSTLTIKNKEGEIRQLPFQKFYKNYKVVNLKDNELIVSISFEIPDKNTSFNFEKVSKRTHLDIASVNTACKITIKTNIISEAHISLGGVAAIPSYLSKTNNYLNGKVLNTSTIIEAEKVLQSEISPISDVRGTSDYKRLIARQLFFAHFIELFPQTINFQNLVSK